MAKSTDGAENGGDVRDKKMFGTECGGDGRAKVRRCEVRVNNQRGKV